MVARDVLDRRGLHLAAALALGTGLALVGLIATAPSASAATTASVSAGRLTVTGTGAGETIVVSALDPSTLRVAATGFSRTFPAAIVRSIRVVAGGGNDTVRIQDGALAFTTTRPTTLDGGGGNDDLTGGRGRETLLGGTGNDTAKGARGNDTVNLGGGADVAVWAVGDGVDTVVGGPGSDVLGALGTAGANAFVLSTAPGPRVRVAVGPGSARAGTVERVFVGAGGGSDTMNAGALAGLGLTEVTLAGEGGTDAVTLTGTAQADEVVVADGQTSADWAAEGTAGTATVEVLAEALTVVGGDGDDTLAVPGALDPVTFEGGPGVDELRATGTVDPDDWFFLAETVGELQFRGGPFGELTVEATTIETVAASPGAGADRVGVAPSATTGVTAFDIDLGVAAAPDGANDQVLVEGTTANDTIQTAIVQFAVNVTGLPAQVSITHSSAGIDTLEVSGQLGNDTISAGVLAAAIAYRADGGAGNDILNGGNGADVLLGGDNNDTVDGNGGNDTILLGDDVDTAVWDPGDGSDIVEGQSDRDTLRFNGAAGAEIFAASSNGGRLLFTRNVGNIIMDTDDVENLEINALGGSDNATVNDLEATDLDRVDIDLGVAGAGDGSVDAVTVNGTAGEDSLQATVFGGELTVRSPAVDVVVDNPEPANDTATVNSAGGNDVIVAGAGTNTVRWTFNGGSDADLLSGSPGADTLNGDAGNDVVLGNAGIDTLNGGTNTDLCDGGADADVHGGGCETLISVP